MLQVIRNLHIVLPVTLTKKAADRSGRLPSYSFSYRSPLVKETFENDDK